MPVILTIDVGNTNILAGLFQGERLLHHWRLATDTHKSTDEYGLLFTLLLREERVEPRQVEAVVIGSVVPQVTEVLAGMHERHLPVEPLIVGPGVKTGIPLLVDNPPEVGADRIANAVAVVERYGGPAVVVDFGTATTLDAVSSDGAYVGGSISPGLVTSVEGLYARAARLRRIDLTAPQAAVGRNTGDALRSGLLYGAAGQVDALVTRFRRELQAPEATVVATGGLAGLVAPLSREIQEVIPQLTLEGLRLIYDRNVPGERRA